MLVIRINENFISKILNVLSPFDYRISKFKFCSVRALKRYPNAKNHGRETAIIPKFSALIFETCFRMVLYHINKYSLKLISTYTYLSPHGRIYNRLRCIKISKISKKVLIFCDDIKKLDPSSDGACG